MAYREVTQADWLAYNRFIIESDSKAELKEQLEWIRNDLLGKYDEGMEEGGWTLVKKK